MGTLSWWHWLLIIAAFILIFGAKKLPDAARGVGRSLRILKSEVAAMHEDGDKPAPTETNASAAVATPSAQIAAPPVAPPAAAVMPQPVSQPVTQPVTQPVAPQPVQQPVTAVQQPVTAPVTGGVPVSQEQPNP